MEEKKTTYREVSYVEEAMRDNSLFSAHTGKWNLFIRPWYNMDKLRFCFVEKGKAGKGNSFTVCVDVTKHGAPCFEKWANDILSPIGRFEKMMALEKDKEEPVTYKFTTGVTGEKTVGIQNSSKGHGFYCIKGSSFVNDKPVTAMVPVDFGDLYILAEAFKFSYENRRRALEDIRVNAENVNSSYYKKESKEDMAEEAATSEPTQEQDTELPDICPNPIDKMVPTSIRVSIGSPVKGKGGFIFEGTEVNSNEPVNLFVSNETLKGEQAETWKKLSDALKETKRTVTFIIEDGEQKVIKAIA